MKLKLRIKNNKILTFLQTIPGIISAIIYILNLIIAPGILCIGFFFFIVGILELNITFLKTYLTFKQIFYIGIGTLTMAVLFYLHIIYGQLSVFLNQKLNNIESLILKKSEKTDNNSIPDECLDCEDLEKCHNIDKTLEKDLLNRESRNIISAAMQNRTNKTEIDKIINEIKSENTKLFKKYGKSLRKIDTGFEINDSSNDRAVNFKNLNDLENKIEDYMDKIILASAGSVSEKYIQTFFDTLSKLIDFDLTIDLEKEKNNNRKDIILRYKIFSNRIRIEELKILKLFNISLKSWSGKSSLINVLTRLDDLEKTIEQ